MLTLGFLLVRTVHTRLKPFPHVYLNNAEEELTKYKKGDKVWEGYMAWCRTQEKKRKREQR